MLARGIAAGDGGGTGPPASGGRPGRRAAAQPRPGPGPAVHGPDRRRGRQRRAAERELVRPGPQPDGDEEARRAVRSRGLEDVSRRRLPSPGHRGQGGCGLRPGRGAGPGLLGPALGRAEGVGPQRPRALHAQAGRVRAVRAGAGTPLLGHVLRPRPAGEDAARGAPVGAVERAQPARVPHAAVAAGQERAAAGVAPRLPLALPGRLRGAQGREPGQPGAAGQHGAERAQLRRRPPTTAAWRR